MTPLSNLILQSILPAILILAALRDATSFTIPNWMSLVAVALFWPAALLAGMSGGAIGISAAVGVAALIAGMGMFALGWIGGGDAKLFAAAALWLGWPAVLPFLVFTAFAGGGLAVALLWSRRLGQPLAAAGPAWFGRLLTPGENVPYGLAIAAGGLIAFPTSALMSALAGV